MVEYYSRERIVELPNKAIIKMAKYSPDGKYLALVAADQHISILNKDTFTMKTRIDCTQYTKINDIDFASHSTIIGAAADNVLVLFGNPRGKLFKAITPEGIDQNQFTIVQFGRDNILVGAATNNIIYIYYDYANPELTFVSFSPHDVAITSINLISLALIITSYVNGVCIKWNSTVDTREEQEFLQILRQDITGKISHSTLSPDNKYLLLTHLTSTISSWKIEDTVANTQSGQYSVTFFKKYLGFEAKKIGEFEIKAKFMFHGENKFVIAGSENNMIYIWCFLTAELLRTLTCSTSCPISIILNPAADLERFAVLQNDGRLFIWKRENID